MISPHKYPDWNFRFAAVHNQSGGLTYMKIFRKYLFAVAPAAALVCAFCGIMSFAEEQTFSEVKDFVGDFRDIRAEAFNRFDVNGKGYITDKDWPGRNRAFRLMDANNDGRVTLEEFQSLGNRWLNRTFENLDLDGNRAITRNEWMDIEDDFDRLDRDKNGMIQRHEFYNPK